jgi:anthranilate phosphoribosyltransferase
MTMICAGTVEPLQVGAFLALLRYRGETPAELAGMVRALRATVLRPAAAPAPDLDWPTYAGGSTRGLPWFVLSALLLAGNGIGVFMHGFGAHQSHPATAERALAGLGVAASTSAAEAGQTLARDGFAFLPLSHLCPQLQTLIELRRLLGLRTAANTIARLLNPFGAPHLIQGVFHPPYRELQQQAAALLGQPRLAVFKGGGGEAERPAHKSCEVFGLDQGRPGRESWPALRPDAGPNPAESTGLLALWRGEIADDHATALVIGTAAVALRLLGRASTPPDADALAAAWWERRDRNRLPLA